MGKILGEKQVVPIGELMGLFQADELLMSHGEAQWMMLWHDPWRIVGCTGLRLPSSCSGNDRGHSIIPLAWRIHWECVPQMLVA